MRIINIYDALKWTYYVHFYIHTGLSSLTPFKVLLITQKVWNDQDVLYFKNL